MATRTSEKPLQRKRAAHLGPERRRPQVLDAALELFLERGYQGTSMDAIAGAAGVSKPVVYACFASKDELFRALLAREEQRILGEIDAAFAGAEEADPETTLVEGFTGFLRAVAASPEVYRLIFLQEGGGNAAIARRIQRGREAQAEALAGLAREWLDRRPAPSEPEPLDREASAQLLGEAIVGLAGAGAPLLLGDHGGFTPESLGPRRRRLLAP